MSRPRDVQTLQREITLLTSTLLEKLRDNARRRRREDNIPVSPNVAPDDRSRKGPDNRPKKTLPAKEIKSFLDMAEKSLKQSASGEKPLIDAGLGLVDEDGNKMTVVKDPLEVRQSGVEGPKNGDKAIVAMVEPNSVRKQVPLTLGNIKEKGIKPQ
jgi:hypothetical protein